MESGAGTSGSSMAAAGHRTMTVTVVTSSASSTTPWRETPEPVPRTRPGKAASTRYRSSTRRRCRTTRRSRCSSSIGPKTYARVLRDSDTFSSGHVVDASVGPR